MNKSANEAVQWIKTILIVIVLFVILRGFLILPVTVKGTSMEPNFYHGDVVVANKISYIFKNPKIKDVVICTYGKNSKSEKLIKRVIGVPGDEINMIVDESSATYTLYVNKKPVYEDYIKEPIQQKGDIKYPFVVSENCYFVMGDNRNVSSDSRFETVGEIPKQNIKGKVFLKPYPFSSFEIIK